MEEWRKYKMNHVNRGIAIVFNHKSFNVPNDPVEERIKPGHDLKLVVKTFTSLGFEVRKFKDKTLAEIQAILHRASQEDHTDRDCLAVITMTHGVMGKLYAQDALYKQETLWLPFYHDRCKTLIGKPKLFFIQACRGFEEDPGIQLVDENSHIPIESVQNYSVERDNSRGTASTHLNNVEYNGNNNNNNNKEDCYILDIEHDFLIAFSTVPHYCSWKDMGCRAWFIGILCQELGRQDNSEEHLLILLSNVNARVSECSTLTEGREGDHEYKQISCVVSRLTKLLYLKENTE